MQRETEGERGCKRGMREKQRKLKEIKGDMCQSDSQTDEREREIEMEWNRNKDVGWRD